MGKTSKIMFNTAILLVIAGFIWYMIRSIHKEEITYAENRIETSFISPYTQVTSFELPEKINRFKLYNEELYISAGTSVYIYGQSGVPSSSFPVKQEARDIYVEKENIYILYPASVEVYNTNGDLLHTWDACSELSDYCSFTLAGEFVFVTDAANKNICKYTKEGGFVNFIRSPEHFIVPSYSFDIESRNDTIYCINPGKHQIESYTLDGDFIAAFGKPGVEEGFFSGCCNPVYISFTPGGELLTSEKGNPRIGCFGVNGEFRGLLLDNEILGGGITACDVEAHDDKLFVARKNKISLFQYDKVSAVKTACSTCKANCPLRKGITI